MAKKNSAFIDIAGITQILGCLYNNPKILESDDKYRFNKEDFVDSFHQIIFSAIYNIYQLGAKDITVPALNDYLAQRPKQEAEYKTHNGDEYVLKCAENANPLTFDYYYNRIKKLTLLREYENAGMDLKWMYNPDVLDIKEKEKQEEWLDNASLEDIANKVNDRLDGVTVEFAEGVEDKGIQLGDHVDDILEELATSPALGYPFYTKYLNTITRGMRPGKFYLRSAATGVGKSRSMIADACFLAMSQMYDTDLNKWVSIGTSQPTLYIATEQDETEVTTMALAFIAGVDEEHILLNNYYVGEEDRVRKASQLLRNGKLYFVCIPDFGISDIQNTIKKHIREYDISYAFFDYIHSSPKILMEVGGKSGVKNLREDNVLFLLSSALKDICTEYGIFIMSSTQLNAAYLESETPNEALLRGSKAIADRLDVGMILMDITSSDKEKLQPFCNKNGLALPNQKISVYKNRGNRYKSIYLWLYSDKATCRFKGAFVTDWNYQIQEVIDMKIKVEESSAF